MAGCPNRKGHRSGPASAGVVACAQPHPARWSAGSGRRRTPRMLRWLGPTITVLWTLAVWGSVPSERVCMPPTAPGVDMREEVAVTPPAAIFWPHGAYVDNPVPYGRGEARPRGNTSEGAEFAAWVVSTDPQRRYVLDAFVRDNRILGVIVNPHLTRGQVQQMLTSLLSAMQRAFPDRLLEVIAYYRSGDQLARLWWDPHTKQ